MTWVIASVDLESPDGMVATYEVGADISCSEPSIEGYYDIGEPTFSAPDGNLATSRLALDPQAPGTFIDGWSEAVEFALIDAYLESRDYDD